MLRILLYIVVCFAGSVGAANAGQLDQKAVALFVAEMVDKHGFDGAELAARLASAKRSERILKAMSRPAEKAKPWFEYRKHFITKARIGGGTKFWRDNADALARAQERFGVPAEVIVAIIGVETAYGKITGKDRVVDALATLAFHYPKANAKRMHFFREQLRHMFLLSREQAFEPLELTGSYAGAMGIPQFMPESFRKFAVDFNDDGVRDIWKDREDAIGSVANYLESHGWQRDKMIVMPARGEASVVRPLITKSVKPHRSIAEFSDLGIDAEASEDSAMAALFELDGEGAPEFYFALDNFYAIMRYNPRTKYAMAVTQLAQAIKHAYSEEVGFADAPHSE